MEVRAIQRYGNGEQNTDELEAVHDGLFDTVLLLQQCPNEEVDLLIDSTSEHHDKLGRFRGTDDVRIDAPLKPIHLYPRNLEA